jgi:hypothetical protein
MPLEGHPRLQIQGLPGKDQEDQQSVKRKESQSTECPGCTRLVVVVVVVSGERTQGGTTAKSQRIRKNLILHNDVVCNF